MSDNLRLPPHSGEAEQGVLGCILAAPALIDECVAQFAAANPFYDTRNATVWTAMESLHRDKKPIDLITLPEMLKSMEAYEKIGGMQYLGELASATAAATNLNYYAEIVRQKALLRNIIRLGTQTVAQAFEPDASPEAIVSTGFAEFNAMGSAGTRSDKPTIWDSCQKIMDRMDAMRNGRKQMLGPSCGFNYLDNILCGLQPEQYIVVAGRPGGGKTMFAMQIAEFWATTLKIPVGIFSLEMSQDELIARMAFSMARAQLQKYRNGFLIMDDVPRLTTAFLKLHEAEKQKMLHIDDQTGLTIEQLSMRIRKMHRDGCRLFIIDYIQLLRGYTKKKYSGDNRNAELTDVSIELLRLKKELKVPIIVLAQMNRNIEANDQRNRQPVLADLKDCGQIEQDADVVMFIYDANMRKQIEDPNPDPNDKALAFLNSAALVNLVPSEWRKISGEDPWHKHLKRQNILVAKQRNGPSAVSGQLVRVNAWMRYIDAFVPPKEDRLLMSDEAR